MNIDTLLQDTFAAHEEHAPDPAGVLAAAQERIAHRRSGLAQPLAIAASVVVAAAMATGAAVAVNRHSGPANRSAAQAASRPTVPTTGHQAGHNITPLTMPYDLGWLPAGTVTYVARRINPGGVRQSSPPWLKGAYQLNVTTAAATIDIDVQETPPLDLAGVAFKSGPGVPVTINGRAGVESKNSGGPAGYEVYFRDAAGGVMYVNAGPHAVSSLSAAELSAIGRHVAENVRFPGRTQVRPTFGVGYVPAGLRVRGFDVECGSSGDVPSSSSLCPVWTSYDVGTSTGPESAVTIGTNAPPLESGTPGRLVQGHPTRYSDDHGSRTLQVLGAVHGRAVLIQSRLPLSELYKIADGLVLPK
jgi:hypothetical protein